MKIKKVDPHVDIADMYKLFKYSQNDFFSDKDLPVTLNKIQSCNISVIGLSLYFDKEFVETNYFDGVISFYKWYKELLKDSDAIQIVKTFDEIKDNTDIISGFYSVEGFHCLRTPDDFDILYEIGTRSFGMTWGHNNDYAADRAGENTGLTKQGIELVKKMDNKKLFVDIAHLGEKSVTDLAQNFNGMILTTHGNCRNVFHSTHNLRDEEIEIIVERRGVVSLFPLSNDTGRNGTFAELYQHAEYIGEKWGDEYIAISSDIYPLDEYPFLQDYEDITVLNAIEDYFSQKMSKKTLQKIFHGNWMRVLEQTL
ncbi:MAG TPA: hypothetical protein ENI23_10050 [bacterium]|nr:hypothetical protein [bacterium]